MTDIRPEPEDWGAPLASEAQTSFGEQLGARVAESWHNTIGMGIVRETRRASAGGDVTGGVGFDEVMTPELLEERERVRQAAVDAIPDTPIDDAKARVKQEGLEGSLKLPDQPSIKSPVLDLMINDAHERRDRQAAIARGPDSFVPNAIGFLTSMGVGMLDPVGDMAFAIPVLGEARVAGMVARAGDSVIARAGVKAVQGGLQGAVGTTLLQPADWWLHTRDGQDYTFANALESVVMGAGMGAAFHAGFGVYGDVRSRMRGAPLAGSPQDLLLRGLMTGTHVHADQLAEDGVPIEDVPGFAAPDAAAPDRPFPGDIPLHPADVLADLPPAAKEDVLHATMADLIAGKPAQAAELLQIAADHDPRIAESIDAWHGSPHDFDRFDINKLGTGEGAQTYGHGLYFAENEKVARNYQRATSDKAFVNKVAELYDEGHSPDDAWGEIKDHWSEFAPAEQRLMTALEKDDWLGFDYPHQAVSAALRDIKAFDVSPETAAAAAAVGHMYRVKVTANHEHFLDWDKPIHEQSEHVRGALQGLGIDHTIATSGEDAYRQLSIERTKYGEPDANGMRRSVGPREASGALRDAGIPGIKYLDQGSRPGPGAMTSAGMSLKEPQKTRNFVVFDDKHIEITHKNGEPLERRSATEPVANATKPVAGATPAPAGNPKIVLGPDPDLVTAPKPRSRAAAHPDTRSLNEHLASQGGLAPHPELKAVYGSDRGPFVPGFGPLIRKGGMTLDDALGSAKQHGYMFDPHDVENGTAGTGGRTSHGLTPNDLLDKLDAENRGQKQYKPGHLEATKYDPEQEKHVILGHLEQALEVEGHNVSEIDPKLLDRTVEIVHRDGVTDMSEAYERAIMEDAESYNAIADARRSDPALADIPGWDQPADARAAPGDGRPGAERGGPAGRPEQGARGADGQESPPDGGRDIAAAAADPRWRQLADTKPDYDEPDVLEESRAADNVEAPESAGTPERALTALEQEAKRAEEIWKQIEPTLTEKERALVNDVLDQLKLDKEARDRIISDGVACLVGAIA